MGTEGRRDDGRGGTSHRLARSDPGHRSGFSAEVRGQVGVALREAQSGGRHRTTTPLRGFKGAGVLEVRADDPDGTYRVVYTVRFRAAVFVLHAFQKKSKQGIATPLSEIRTIEKRLVEARAAYVELFGEDDRR